jgi:hypothetical protein
MLVPFSALGIASERRLSTMFVVFVEAGLYLEIAEKYAVVPALSITIGETVATPEVLETSLSSVCRRGSVVRGSLWEELDEPEGDDEPEGGFEPDELADEPDCEPEELEDPDVLLLDEPDFVAVDELEVDAGLAGDPSLTAISNGPFTPGPKYFAVRS